MAHDVIGPTRERIELLDSLRGFALAGVLFANLTAFSLYFFLPESATTALASAPLDRWLQPFDHVFVTSRFITLFSLLFGIGFALQMQRAADSRDGLARYLRRLAILLLIGLLHADLLWWGDILRYYALIGLILVPARRLGTCTMAVLGTLLAIVPYQLVSAFWQAAGTVVATREQAYAAALAAFSSHDWGTMLRGNLAFGHWWLGAHWGQACWVAGCFLIGTALGRQGVLREPERHRRFWRWMLRGAVAGLLVSLAIELLDYGYLPFTAGWRDASMAVFAMKLSRDAAILAMAMGYMAIMVALFARPAARRWLRHLAPVGRMALSNYLAHSLLGIALFYGVGLAIGPRHGLVGVSIAFLAIFAAQIAFSRWWLGRYRFGPAEWAWRSLTYRRRQPMRMPGGRGRDETAPGIAPGS